MNKYEDTYRRLQSCFSFSFGDNKGSKGRKGLISMEQAKRLIYMRQKSDIRNNLPGNSLIDIPKTDKELYELLNETYLGRDSSCASGPIGCAETPEEQLDGITNMVLLMYLSNHLSKEYKFLTKQGLFQGTLSEKKQQIYEKNEKILLTWKDTAITDAIASIYVLSKTDDEYKDFFSYGNRTDDNGNSTFVVDLPYIGQLSVHFGWEEKKNSILENASNSAKSILEKKLKLGQITKEQKEKITTELDEKGVLPEYEGKLFEYVGALPVEFIGEKIKKCRSLIGNKLPENITNDDIKKLADSGLNQRELYYFFIKMGASKDLLNKISGTSKEITPSSIKEATQNVTISEFKEATQNLKGLTLSKDKLKQDINTRE